MKFGLGMRFRRVVTFTILAALGLVVGVPGPVGADSYTDDDGGFYEPAFDALEERGILEMTECGEGLVCPGDDMKRWVMAVWLVRALDGADPEGVTTTRFVDVDAGEWWMPFVERLAELGVTKGCKLDPAEYCPDEPVTRGQMASFLTRAFDLEPARAAGFVDIGGSSHQAHINALAAANITRGCDTEPARYCPGSNVTRGQMATFLARALDLVPRPPPVGQSTVVVEPPGIPQSSVRMGIYPCCADLSLWQIPIEKGWFEELNISMGSGSPHYFAASPYIYPWLRDGDGDVAGTWIPGLFGILEVDAQELPPILFHGPYLGYMILVSPNSDARTTAEFMDQGMSYPDAAQAAIRQVVGKHLYIPPHSTTQSQFANSLFAYLDEWWQDLKADVPLLDSNGNPMVRLDRQGNPVTDSNGNPIRIKVNSQDWRYYAKPQYTVDPGIVELAALPGGPVEFAMPFGVPTIMQMIRHGWEPLNSYAMMYELDGASPQADLANHTVGGTGLIARRQWIDNNRDTAYRLLSLGYRAMAYLEDPGTQLDGWAIQAGVINRFRGLAYDPEDMQVTLDHLTPMFDWETQEATWNVDLAGYHPETAFALQIDGLKARGILSAGFDTEAELARWLVAQDLYHEMKQMQQESDALFTEAEQMNLSPSQASVVEQARVFYDRYNFLDSLRYLKAALQK